MTTYFTADLHFGHEKIIAHCRRPFASVDEMDAELVRRWNAIVTAEDVVYVLGDFIWKGTKRTMQDRLSSLNGVKVLIAGNHDTTMVRRLRWLQVYDYLELDAIVEPKRGEAQPQLVLCHYPIQEWNRKRHGSLHLHGHTHGELERSGLAISRRWDVGVDTTIAQFAPVALQTILDYSGVKLLDEEGKAA